MKRKKSIYDRWRIDDEKFPFSRVKRVKGTKNKASKATSKKG